MSDPNGGRVHATFWCQVEPIWLRWSPWSLRGAKVTRLTRRRPSEPGPGSVLVKLTISLPIAAFVPPFVEGEVDLAPGEWTAVPATVEASPVDPAVDNDQANC